MFKLRGILLSIFTSSLMFANDTTLLVDLSGSMSNRESEIKILVSQYINQKIQIFGFNDKVFELKKISDVYIDGSTNLAKALNKVNNSKYVILATDGKPDDELAVKNISSQLKQKGVKICSIFLSERNSVVPNILNEISDEIFNSQSLNSAHQLCVKTKEKWISEDSKIINNDIKKFTIFGE